MPSLIGLLGGFGAGVAYSFVRLMSKKGVHSTLIVFVFSTFSCLVCLPYFIAVHAPMTLSQLLCLLAAGTFGCTGQFAITSAYRFAPAKEISVYDYTQVVFAALLGWAHFWSAAGCLQSTGLHHYLRHGHLYVSLSEAPRQPPCGLILALFCPCSSGSGAVFL